MGPPNIHEHFEPILKRKLQVIMFTCLNDVLRCPLCPRLEEKRITMTASYPLEICAPLDPRSQVYPTPFPTSLGNKVALHCVLIRVFCSFFCSYCCSQCDGACPQTC